LTIFDRQIRVGFAQLVTTPVRPAVQPLAQQREWWDRMLAPELGDVFAWCTPSHRDHDTTVLDRVGEIADAGDDRHRERRAQLALAGRHVPADVRPARRVPAVEYSAQVLRAFRALPAPGGEHAV